MEKAGILMAISSLPSKYGVGDFGFEAYRFIDLCNTAKIELWQILPLNHLGEGNSPYQPYSSVALDDLYLSLDVFKQAGLIKVPLPSYNSKTSRIDFSKTRKFKSFYYKKAFENFNKNDLDYQTFIKKTWVKKYAYFMVLKDKYHGKVWNVWQREDQNLEAIINKPIKDALAWQIDYQMFLQFMLYKQWHNLKNYANQKGIKIIGDLPFYVGMDSLDVLDNQRCFLLDANKKPSFVAGVPPDYFSKDGQKWGNPIYDWNYIKSDNFKFFRERFSQNKQLFDEIKVDHFRGYEAFWKIPATSKTASYGVWEKAFGNELFSCLQKCLPDLKIIAEDLGEIDAKTKELREKFAFSGMKVLQFAMDDGCNDTFLDYENMVVYTGTHDNQTIVDWYNDRSTLQKAKLNEFFKSLNYHNENINEDFIEYAFSSMGKYAIIPIQDILGLNDIARMNTPGTVSDLNWSWKLRDFNAFSSKLEFLRTRILKYKRT